MITVEDANVLRALVRATASRRGRALTGCEIGAWLGRSTLTILRPDVPLATPVLFEGELWDFANRTYDEPADLERAVVEFLEAARPRLTIELLREWMIRFLADRVVRVHCPFATFWVVDTWAGLTSERSSIFREDDPLARFLANVEAARLQDVVRPLRGDSRVLDGLPAALDFAFVDGDHEYESVVRDLYALRDHVAPDTVLCGHDVAGHSIERWPGVHLAVTRFVQHFEVRANVWVARPEGIAHLQSLPPFEDVAADVHADHERLLQRYESLEFRSRWNVEVPTRT